METGDAREDGEPELSDPSEPRRPNGGPGDDG
jgi:hypothetical protein